MESYAWADINVFSSWPVLLDFFILFQILSKIVASPISSWTGGFENVFKIGWGLNLGQKSDIFIVTIRGASLEKICEKDKSKIATFTGKQLIWCPFLFKVFSWEFFVIFWNSFFIENLRSTAIIPWNKTNLPSFNLAQKVTPFYRLPNKLLKFTKQKRISWVHPR